MLKAANCDSVLTGNPTLAYLSSLPILAVVYRFFYLFYLPTANLPIYHNLPISTDFFADLPNFNFFLPIFLLFHVNYALTNVTCNVLAQWVKCR